LVLALWALTLLAVFALSISVQARQKLNLLSRIESRSELPFTAESGINIAVALIKKHLAKQNYEYNAEEKRFFHNNPVDFGEAEIGLGIFEVSYYALDSGKDGNTKRFGVIDEQSKININKSDKAVLQTLIKNVLEYGDEEALELAEAIVDWREEGESDPGGFYSDSYYSALRYPYETKDSEFEHINEFLVLRAVTSDIFERLLPHITIYGDGRVNVNTASKQALRAIGFSNALTEAILEARRGSDGIEATEDDFIFANVHKLAADLEMFSELETDDVISVNYSIAGNLLTTSSSIYRIKSLSKRVNSDSKVSVECVYDAMNDGFKYWREYR